MIRAVWSFWSAPFREHHHAVWSSEKAHLLAWVLSVEEARKHYPVTCLYTDNYGARMLVDELGLSFDHVSTLLNVLNKHDMEWWALGKVYTYRSQKDPFVHVDSDVFLWKKLPKEIENAHVLAQNPEHFVEGYSYYKPHEFDVVLQKVGGWKPKEWEWFRKKTLHQRGECCGIFGGNRVDFIRYYAEQAIKLIEFPANQCAWQLIPNKVSCSILFEQYLLSACIEYHKKRISSSFHDVDVQYLFNSLEEAYIPANSERLGFTHLIASAKKDRKISARLEKRVMRDYPAYYERCMKYLDNHRMCVLHTSV